MRDKITEILNLIKVKKFKEAQIKCDDIKKHFDENVEFSHIYGFIFFNLNNYEKAIEQWEKAIKIAELLSDNLPGIRFEIDMDYNDDEFYMSNKLVSAAKGWATSFGYKVNIKPNKQIATRAADYHCR